MKNARIVIFILFLYVFGVRSHQLVYTKMHCNKGYVCWQTFSSSSDEKIVLAAESIVGYSVVFVVFIENLILIALLASRKTIQVGRFVLIVL